MTIQPGCWDFKIRQGATFETTITWTDDQGNLINLSGYTAEMQVRYEASDPSPIVNLTSSNGGITLGGAAGTIALLLAASATAALQPYAALYDLKLTSPGGDAQFLLRGNFIVYAAISQ